MSQFFPFNLYTFSIYPSLILSLSLVYLSEPDLPSLEYFYSHSEENAKCQLNLPIQVPPPCLGLVNYADQFASGLSPLHSTFQNVVRFMFLRQAWIDIPRRQHCVLTLLWTRAPVPAYNRQWCLLHHYPGHFHRLQLRVGESLPIIWVIHCAWHWHFKNNHGHHAFCSWAHEK